MGVSEQAKERERECFSLPLATVRGGRLQPVVFSLSVTHTHTTHPSACWTAVCLLTFSPNVSLCDFLRHEGSFTRIRKREEATRKAAKD